MKVKIQLIFLIIIVGYISCKKKEKSEFTDSPIIESYLISGNFLYVKISRQIPFNSDIEYSTDDLNKLNVNVSYNNKIYILTSLGDGKYIDSTLVIEEGSNYNLTFSYNSTIVKAYTNIPSKPQNYSQSITELSIERMDSTSGPPSETTMPDPLKLTWDNLDDSYYIVVIENIETSLDPIRDFGDKDPPGNMIRKPPTNSSGEEIRAQEFQYFGKHRLILFHVLPDYASLYEEKSTSSLNLSNPSTSIINGYGIFTGLNTDTLYINVKAK